MNTYHTITKTLHRLTLNAAIAAAALFAAPTNAQVNPGDGRALDNNLQVDPSGTGAGGANPLQRQNFSGGNNLITGNVPGLANFRDSVGYGAPGEFGDSLGSDDLFRFHAQSFGSNPALAGSNPGSANLYRSFSNPNTGTLNPNQFSTTQQSAAAYREANLVVSASSLSTGVALGLIPPDVTEALNKSNIRQADLLSVTRQNDGRYLRHTASPLLGVRAQTIGDQQLDEQEQQQVAQNKLPLPQLGPHVHRALAAQGQTPDNTLKQYTQEIETALFKTLVDYNAKPGEDVYLDLLAKIKEQLDEQPHTPTETDPDKSPSSRLVPHTQQPTNNTDDPDDTPQEDAQTDNARRARGLPITTTPPTNTTITNTQNPDPDDSTQQPQIPEEHLPVTARLMKTLDYEIPPLKTFAGESDNHTDELLRKAESDLAAGRYFDAESKYRRVTRLAADNPLPRVGLIHAQLGAGQIRSASFNLRRLYQLNPELIAARYQPHLLPNSNRLKWLHNELNTILKRTTSPDPAIVKAYIAYQQDDLDTLAAALTTALERAPTDPLIPTLKRIWQTQTPPPAQE